MKGHFGDFARYVVAEALRGAYTAEQLRVLRGDAPPEPDFAETFAESVKAAVDEKKMMVSPIVVEDPIIPRKASEEHRAIARKARRIRKRAQGALIRAAIPQVADEEVQVEATEPLIVELPAINRAVPPKFVELIDASTDTSLGVCSVQVDNPEPNICLISTDMYIRASGRAIYLESDAEVGPGEATVLRHLAIRLQCDRVERSFQSYPMAASTLVLLDGPTRDSYAWRAAFGMGLTCSGTYKPGDGRPKLEHRIGPLTRYTEAFGLVGIRRRNFALQAMWNEDDPPTSIGNLMALHAMALSFVSASVDLMPDIKLPTRVTRKAMQGAFIALGNRAASRLADYFVFEIDYGPRVVRIVPLTGSVADCNYKHRIYPEFVNRDTWDEALRDATIYLLGTFVMMKHDGIWELHARRKARALKAGGEELY